MTLRVDLRTELRSRLIDPLSAIWSDTDLNGYLSFAIKGLYPSWYRRDAATTTAGVGPLQTMPVGARNLYFVGHQRVGSTRVRKLRLWQEGSGTAIVPKSNISGDTLFWSWTKGYTAPVNDVTPLDIPEDSEEVVLLRAQISAIEAILNDRVTTNKYLALVVREGVGEDDLANTLDALHASVRQRLDYAMTLPEIEK